jgi:NADH-quinone oxidoreductase subunit F
MSIETIGCWDPLPQPAPGLLATLRRGSLAGLPEGAAQQDAIARLRRERVARPVVMVGTGTCGLGAGAGRTLAAVRAYVSAVQLDVEVVEVGCVGLCSVEPLVDVQLPGRARLSFGPVPDSAVPELLEGLLAGKVDRTRLLGQHRAEGLRPWDDVPWLDAHPFLAGQRRLVLAGSGLLDPGSIDEYIARGGYSALFRTLATHSPDEVVADVELSGLRGRGGGGFPTGRKWRLARQSPVGQRYLICNADEGDPGAFMDRAVCESDPHRLLEGMLIAAYAIGATKAYVYIRAEYPLGVARLEQAIGAAREYGLLGENILGTGLQLDIAIKMGAGAFVCGEETALIHSIEGKRGMPRPRPPYPVVQGLFGRPTVINNVETLANLPWLFEHGAAAFAALGTAGSKGSKVFALSGMVARTGLVEVPMGTTLRQVVFGAGGGIPGGRRCKAVQIGGPSGGCIPERELDIACDYEALKQFGAIMGSGGLVVMDESTCMVDLAKYFMEFIQAESCGKCIPCREGTKHMLEILQSITRSERREQDLDPLLRFQGVMQLEHLAEVIRSTSLCGLGQTAPNPVLSTLRWFRAEYEAHVYERRCPAGACKELVGAPCQTGCPVGTEVWRYVAHVARGENDEAYRVIRAANPFPSTCARVCHHPCESVCRAGTTGGDPVAVRALKRFVVDQADPAAFVPVVAPAGPDAARVAVVGGGPAGLTAAHLLSLQGHRVTIFEQEDRLGGMLVAAIPEYRLPRAPLDREIAALQNANIEVRCGVALGRDVTPAGLLADGYRAVYVALGSHQSKRLDLPGEDADGVIPSIRFLKAANLRGEAFARGVVGIVGGGNSAIDAARVAIRQPGVTSVTVYYRRARDEMPAYAEEVAAALEEGVVLETLVAPVALQTPNGRLTSVRLQQNELGEPDASGRRRPVPIPGSERDVPLDTLVVAIGEQPEATALPGLALTRGGTLMADPESMATNVRGVFAGGDVVSGPRTLVEAVADGKRAAAMIDRFVRGKLLRTLGHVPLPSVFVPPCDDEEAEAPRAHPPLLPVAERRGNCREVELALPAHAARCEARRCLRCDLEFTQSEARSNGAAGARA